MRYQIQIVIVLLLMSWGLQAQNIRVIKDSEVSRVMDQYASGNRLNSVVPGWRIQLLATTDRRKMEEAKEGFMQKFPQIPIDFIHASPYYKVRVGAFASKIDVYRVLHQVKRDYPSAYPTKDKNIQVGELLH